MRILRTFLPILLIMSASTALGQTVKINRSKPLDPVKFIGDGWTIAEQDERSLSLTKIDLSKVKIENGLRENETCVVGEERLKRLKGSGYVHLDAKILVTLLNNQKLIPNSWKGDGGYSDPVLQIFFYGTIFKSPDGSRHVAGMVFFNGEWHGQYLGLSSCWTALRPSVVMAIAGTPSPKKKNPRD